MTRSLWSQEDQGVILEDKLHCSKDGTSVCHGCIMVVMGAVFVLPDIYWFVGVKRDGDSWN